MENTIDFDHLIEEDLLDIEEVQAAFKAHLVKKMHCSSSQASDLSSKITNPYLSEILEKDYECCCTVGDTEYDVWSCVSNFDRYCFYNMMDTPRGAPFTFYVLFNSYDVRRHCVGDYIQARKKYIIP